MITLTDNMCFLDHIRVSFDDIFSYCLRLKVFYRQEIVIWCLLLSSAFRILPPSCFLIRIFSLFLRFCFKKYVFFSDPVVVLEGKEGNYTACSNVALTCRLPIEISEDSVSWFVNNKTVTFDNTR